MAVFNPGTSSLKTTSYEAALHEAIQLLRRHLKADARTRIGIEISEDSTIVNCSVQLPLMITIAVSGSVEIQAIDETEEFNWIPDPTSNASAVTLAGQILAIAAKINSGTGIGGGVADIDRCQLSISTDTKTAVIITEFLLDDRPTIPALTFGIAPYIQDFSS